MSKIVVDADFGRVDAAAKKSQEAVKSVGKEAAKTDKHLQQWTNSMAGAAVRAVSVLNAIKSVGAEFERQRQERVSASKETGTANVKRARNLRALGFDKTAGGIDAAVSAQTGGDAAVSQDEMDSFVEQLAGSKEKIKTTNAARAMSLFRTGVFSKEELAAAATSTRSLDKLSLQTNERIGKLSQAEREEFAITAIERREKNRADEVKAQGGLEARAVDAVRERQKAESPFTTGFQNVVQGVTGGVVDINAVDRKISEFGGRGGAVTDTLKELNKNIKNMNSPRPNFAVDPRGGE